ncbi:MAG: N-acetylmuramoyl-L-alanine amidase [Actinomycetota bacterium]
MRRPLFTTSLTLAVSLGLSGLSWVQPAAGQTFPETEFETAPVEIGAFRPHGGGAVRTPTAHGVLRTTEPGSTGPVEVCSPIWFTSIGVTWDQPVNGPVAARVALSDDGTNFDAPDEVHAVQTETPDPGSADDRSADLAGGSADNGVWLWTDGARCMNLGFEVGPGIEMSDVRVMFINTSGSSAGPGTEPEQPDGSFGLPSAEAWTEQPTIHLRNEWNARPRSNSNQCQPIDYAPAVKAAFVHHTDTPNAYTKDEVDDILRGIQAYHMNGRGWCDIAYNFLIDKFGRVWEGRDGGITKPVVSGATQGVNTGSVSVSLIGSHQRARPKAAAMTALKRFLAWRLDIAHVRPNTKTTLVSSGGDNTKYDPGDVVHLKTISGHRDTGYTDCPGNQVYKQLDNIRRAVSNLGKPKMFGPKATPDAIEQGSGDTIRFKADATGVLQWTLEFTKVSDGSLVRTITAGGNPLSVAWHGNDDASNPAPTGAYDVKITAERASDGANARPATLRVRVTPP